MKSLFLPLLMISLFFISCKEEDEQPEMIVEGEWELVKSVGSFGGAVQEGDELEWVESYLFKSDSTFVKRREEDQKNYHAMGKYRVSEAEVSNSDNIRYYLELDFESGDKINGDCYVELEYLIITKEGQLKNTWGACDGPTLYYNKNS